MILKKALSILQLDYVKLIPILGLAVYVSFIPHQSYPYPLHVDEWLHLAFAKAIMDGGNATIVNPFSGDTLIGPSTNLEAGFHIFWGIFQRLSGISWIAIFRYFPSIIFIITILAVYAMTRRMGFGLEAAFFTSLIPTTVGILGPAFLVPVSAGLLFTPLILFLAFNFRSGWSYLIIFLFISFLLAIHAPSAVIPIIVLAPFILLNLRGNFKHSLGLILALILPFLIVFPWIFELLLPTANSLLTAQAPTEFVQLPKVIQTYGYFPMLFCLLGTFLLVAKGGRQSYGLIFGLLALLLMLVTFFTFHYGVPIIYERGLLYLMLMVGIVAGAGLAGVKNLRLPTSLSNHLKTPLITQNLGKFLYLILIVLTLVTTIPVRLNTPYYHMIDEQDYQAFVWIGENLSKENGKVLLDPWKATAFTAITSRSIHTRIHAFPTKKDIEANSFIIEGSTDTTFLRENGISLIYTRIYNNALGRHIDYPSDNPDLKEVAKNIYQLKKL